MDTGPLGWHFSTSVGGEGSEVAMHGKSSEGQALLVKALLQEAVALSHLRTGDHVLAGEAELLHSRKLAQRGEPLDLEGPLQVLASLAHGLNPSAP